MTHPNSPPLTSLSRTFSGISFSSSSTPSTGPRLPNVTTVSVNKQPTARLFSPSPWPGFVLLCLQSSLAATLYALHLHLTLWPGSNVFVNDDWDVYKSSQTQLHQIIAATASQIASLASCDHLITNSWKLHNYVCVCRYSIPNWWNFQLRLSRLTGP